MKEKEKGCTKKAPLRMPPQKELNSDSKKINRSKCNVTSNRNKSDKDTQKSQPKKGQETGVVLSLGEFFRETREDRIEELIKRLEENSELYNNDVTDAERETWRESLPDFAEMLWYPRKYMYRTAYELLRMSYFVDRHIEDELRKILDCDAYERLKYKRQKNMEKPGNISATANMFPYRNSEEKQEVKVFWDLRKDEMLAELGIDEGIIQKDGNGEQSLLDGVVVHLEEIVGEPNTDSSNNKRIDVRLKDMDSDRSIVVELKRWTESQIEWNKEKKTINIFPYSDSHRHPLIQAAYYAFFVGSNKKKDAITWEGMTKKGGEIIRKCNEADGKIIRKYSIKDGLKFPRDYRKEDGSIADIVTDDMKREIYIMSLITEEEIKKEKKPSVIPLVYLHNQVFKNGKLYAYGEDDGYIRPALIGNYYFQNCNEISTIFSRNQCHNAIKAITEFFKK